MVINEVQPSIAFCEFAFAIECMLQNQKDFITKSITAQISEYATFIVGDDLDSRKEIQSLFKKLYNTRSKIAHGQKAESIEMELAEIIWLSKQIKLNILIKPEFANIKNMNDLKNLIDNMKYK